MVDQCPDQITATLATWRHLDLGVSIVCISAELHTENSLSCAQIHRDILGYVAGVQCSWRWRPGAQRHNHLGRKHVPQVDKYVSNRLSKNAIKTFYLLDQLEKLECAKAAYLLLPLLHFGYLS